MTVIVPHISYRKPDPRPPFLTPLLFPPPELLPQDWPGPALREQYDRYDAAYRATLRDWFAAAT